MLFKTDNQKRKDQCYSKNYSQLCFNCIMSTVLVFEILKWNYFIRFDQFFFSFRSSFSFNSDCGFDLQIDGIASMEKDIGFDFIMCMWDFPLHYLCFEMWCLWIVNLLVFFLSLRHRPPFMFVFYIKWFYGLSLLILLLRVIINSLTLNGT